MRHAGHFCALVLALSLSAQAQDGFVSYIEVDAEHTVLVQPTYVEFGVIFDVELPPGPQDPAPAGADSLLQTVDERQKAFRQAINELELRPIEIEFSTPTVRNTILPAVAGAARMKYSLAGFANPETGPAQFAALCDTLAGIAKKLEVGFVGPEFGVEDKESVVRNAVTQATTNAYPISDALALALSARIESVETVKVTEIKWSANGEPVKGVMPSLDYNLRQIACTAKVHVTYAARTAAP